MFCSASDPEFITYHVSQYGGALITEQFFRILGDLQIVSCCIESNAFLKSIAATHMSVSHSLLFWEMSLYVIKWCVVWNVFLNPAWSAHWYRSSTALKDHRSACSSSQLFCMSWEPWNFVLMIKLKISCIIVIAASSAPLISSALIPLLSADFLFETVDCNHQFFSGEFWDWSILLIVFNIIVSTVPSVVRSCFAVLLVFSFIVLI